VVAGVKLSQITPTTSPPADADQVVGVVNGNLDRLFNGSSFVRPVGAGVIDYFVNPITGSDSNNGLTAGTAFQTIQHAAMMAATWAPEVDLVGQDDGSVQIVLADGTYNESFIVLPEIPTGRAFIANHAGIQTNSTINGTFYCTGSRWGIGFVTLQNAAMSIGDSACVMTDYDGVMNLVNVNFGACGGGGCIFANFGTHITINSNTTISGTGAYFIQARHFSSVVAQHMHLTLSVDPHWNPTLLSSRDSFIHYQADVATVGTSTGAQYNSTAGSIIINNSGAAVPGNTVGTPDHTGLVVDEFGNNVLLGQGFAGDSGAGGQVGYVPAPAAGDAAAAKFLKADGTWSVPAGSGGPGGVNKNIQYNNSGAFGGFGLYDTTNNNIGVGTTALNDLTAGARNTALGFNTGRGVTTGNNNTILGAQITGLPAALSNNLVISDGAGRPYIWTDDPAGSGMLAWGLSAGNFQVVSGTGNICMGGSAGTALTTGNGNVFLGVQSGRATTSGASNFYMGFQGGLNATGSNNLAIGPQNLAFYVTGDNNIALGSNAMSGGAGGGTNNVAIGQKACYTTTTASNNVGIGQLALTSVTSGNPNICIGNHAGTNITTSTDNVAVGDTALAAVTTNAGISNIGIGSNAGKSINGGNSNVCMGANALQANVSGNQNTAIGHAAAYPVTGNGGVFIGLFSGFSFTTGDNNTCVGYQAGGNFFVASPATGANNTFVGFSSGGNSVLTTAAHNVCVGSNSGIGLTSGGNNVFIGGNNGAGRSVTTGSSNVVIGDHAGVAATSNALWLSDGAGSLWMQGDSTGAVQFPRVTTTASAANAFLDGASSPVNNLLRSTSSLRYKTAVSDIPKKRIEAIMALRPIEFTSLCERDDKTVRHVGYGAEEVAAIDPVLAVYDEQGRPDGVAYERVLLLQIEALKQEIRELKARLS
jgi:hypothetical protein